MCWPQVVVDRKGFFDRFKLRINIFMLWWCFYIFLLQQTQIAQNSASSLIQLFHLTVYFLQLFHKSPGLSGLFWVVCIKNIIFIYLFIYIYFFFIFFCNYERREGPKCRNTREADRIQDLRACFIKTKAEWHKKIKHEIQKKNKNESKGQKDKVATNSMKTQGTKTRKTPQGDTGRLGNRLRK